MKGLLTGILLSFIIVALYWHIDRPSAEVHSSQPVIIEDIKVKKGAWKYQVYTGSYLRLTVVSDSPLGYSVGDTLQFAGSNHPCEKIKRKRRIHNSSFEPIVEKPE